MARITSVGEVRKAMCHADIAVSPGGGRGLHIHMGGDNVEKRRNLDKRGRSERVAVIYFLKG